MEPLASLFVGIVTLLNTSLPDANIARTLGVSVNNNSVLSLEDENVKKRIEAMSYKFSASRMEFKEKIGEIRDARKKSIIEKLDANLNEKNKKWVDNWEDVLDRLSAVALKLKARGVDTTDAETKIAEAKAAVTTQSAKDYVITITDESKLRESVSPILAQFKADVRSTHESVKKAREAVSVALRTLKDLEKEGNE